MMKFLIFPVLQIHNRSLGWALGFMINATNLLPTEKPSYRVKNSVFLAVVIVGGMFIGMGVALIFISFKKLYRAYKPKPTGLIL